MIYTFTFLIEYSHISQCAQIKERNHSHNTTTKFQQKSPFGMGNVTIELVLTIVWPASA